MTDVVRDFLEAPFVVITDEEILNRREYKVKALAALDAEREAHAQEVADLKDQITGGLKASADQGVLYAQKCKEVADLKQRISDLEAQLQDEQP